MPELRLTSEAFADGERIPERHTCEGEDVSPPLAWSDPPDGTRSFALVVEDPDAPGGMFTHWLAWGLEAEARGLAEADAPPLEGENGFGSDRYRGPCPPPGHGRHRYVFRLHALDAQPDLGRGASRDEVERALAGHTLGVAELVGTYER